MLNIPVLRRVVRTPHNLNEVHRTLPMTYDSNRLTLINLGEDAKFKDHLSYYNFRRRIANEANQKGSLHCLHEMRPRPLHRPGTK